MKSKPCLHVFSGLGADERAFQRLDLSGFEVVFIRWITPTPREVMAHYAKRLCAQIKTPSPILLGLSFGGMMAVEVARHVEARKIILLSSAATRQEIPPCYRLFGAFSLHRRLPARLLTTPNPVVNYLFGVRSPEDKALLAEILKDTDPDFLLWALDAIAHWENTERPARLIHIHGVKDRILPIRYLHADIEIASGGHSMVLDHAREITKILRQIVPADGVIPS